MDNTPSTALAVPTIPVADILPSLSNPRKRFDPAYLGELAESIKTHGVIQPITVRPASVDRICAWNGAEGRDNEDPGAIPRYEIVVGECRWRAAQLAGLTEIPGYWRDIDDKQVLEIQVIENLQRRDVHPIEEADGYHRLIEKHGYTAEQIGEKIGKSRSYVYARMKLSALGDIAREAFFDGEFDASVALMIARIPDEKEQRKAVNGLRGAAAQGEPISFRDAKWRLRNGFTKELSSATFKTDDSELLPSAGSCTDCPKRSGTHPELHPDIESADVCTDPKCFEEKRQARHQQLLDAYETRQIKVLSGDDVKTIAPSSFEWSIDRDEWTVGDDEIPDDPEGRTYRDALGDDFPATAVLVIKSNNGSRFVEVASNTAIADALKKAGITTAEDDDEVNDDPEEQNSATTANLPRPDQQKSLNYRVKLEAEKKRRADLLAEITTRLGLTDTFTNRNPDGVIAALAISWLCQETSYADLPETTLRDFGIKFPDPWESDSMLATSRAEIATWPVGKVVALLARAFTEDERYDVFNYGQDAPTAAHGLEALARSVGIDTETFGAAPPSSQAAQAAEPKRADEGGLVVGDRVRIRNDLTTGTAAWRRKVSGREGVIEAFADGGAYFDVRIGEGKAGLVKGLVWNEVEKIEPATIAAQASDQGADPIETNETPIAAQPAEATTDAEGTDAETAIETNEKPTEAAKGTALYTHPDNPDLTWSGRGRKPTWVQSWLADGNTLDELRAS